MVSSKESKVKWTKILESLCSEHELVKSITEELSSIKLSQSSNTKQSTTKAQQQKRRGSTKTVNPKGKKGGESEEKENQNTNPEEVARNLASEYNDDPEENQEGEEPEADP